MLKRLLLLAAAVALAAPAFASADLTALDGTRVWVSGPFGHETLMMQKGTEAAAPVPGAVEAKAYQSIDLGHDAKGRLTLTYVRCLTRLSKCNAMRDDLAGHRSTLRNLAPAGCSVSTAPALWGTRMAYGIGCAKGSRGGLYVKNGSAVPKRLPLPRAAVKYGSKAITWVDLRGTRVGAVAADIYEYAFSESVNGHALRSYLAAASEGDSDEHVVGLAVGTGGALWTLTNAEHAGDPNIAVINHLTATCQDYETIANPAGPDQETGYLATGLGVDGTDVYLQTPSGVVQHAFAPDTVSACGSSSSAPASAG